MSSKCLCPIAVIIALLAPAASSQGGKDNVLILVADDLGVEKLGIYKEGPNPAPTPTIDALARRGVLFRNAYANSLCKPTRGCLMTGRYGLRTRVDVSNSGVLSLDEITIPEVLDAGHSGYAHAAIGKWHLCRQNQDSHPNDSGWSHFSGLLGAGVFDYSRWPRTVDGKTRFSSSYATTQMVDDALSWIGQQNKPWVCYLSFIAPHLPFHAPPSHLHTRNLAGKNPATDPIPFYQAMIESLDTEIARLFSSLGTSTMARTNVVFLGDNGTPKEVAQAPFIASHAKSTPYEGGINVPLIAAGPAVRSPGREVTALVSAVDLFATVAELTGVDVAKVVPPWVNLDSVSFAPYLSNPSQPDLREMVYTELFTGTDWDSVTGNGFLTVRDKRYKRIHRVFRKTSPIVEFYDLQADPFEKKNLAKQLSAEQKKHYTSLGEEIGRLRQPTGNFTSFGAKGCVGSGGSPFIHWKGTPSLGKSYDVFLASGAPASMAVLFSGTSHRRWEKLALPFDLSSIGGGASCMLYSSGEVRLASATSSTGGASVRINVPGSTRFVGVTLFHTWLVKDAAAPGNALGVTSSDAGAAVIGI